MNKITSKLRGNRFIPSDKEELSALELIKKVVDKVNYGVNKINEYDVAIKDSTNKVNNFDKKIEKYINLVEELPSTNATAEVVEARKGEKTLGDKIKIIDEHLDRRATNLQTQVNNIVLGADETDEHIKAEVQQSRGIYSTLNERLDKTLILEKTRNLADLSNIIVGKAYNLSSNKDRAILPILISPNTKYIISFNDNNFDSIILVEKENYDDTTYTYLSSVESGAIRETSSTSHYIFIQFNKTDVSIDDFTGLYLQLEQGDVKTNYETPLSIVDLISRKKLSGIVTPEMFGAKGDGVTDDTVALLKAISTSNNIIALNKYLISKPLILDKSETNFIFNKIEYNGKDYAIKISNQNIKVLGNYLTSENGNGIAIGELGLAYNINININTIRTPISNCYKLGGNEPVSQCVIEGTQCQYGINGVFFDLENYWVGQNTFNNMKFFTDKDSGGYAFFANGSKNPLTGLTTNNISLEGANGGFEFVNTQAQYPIETLNCFGLRTSEMSIRDKKNVMRYTGSGIIRGKMILDACDITKFDFSGATNMRECFTVEGRIIGANDEIYGIAIGNINKLSPIKLSKLIENS